MKKYLVLIIIILALAGGGYYYFMQNTKVEYSQKEVTTMQTRIDKIKEIGEWEFLTINDEEIVEYTKIEKRMWPLSDKKHTLSRIYPATLRLGFDLKNDVKEGWISEHGDSVEVVLPQIRLLDERFVDEAASRSLIEDGEFTHADRSKLYDQAVKKIKTACLTKENIARAETSAKEQMEQLLKSLGFKTIAVSFDKK